MRERERGGRARPPSRRVNSLFPRLEIRWSINARWKWPTGIELLADRAIRSWDDVVVTDDGFPPRAFPRRERTSEDPLHLTDKLLPLDVNDVA